MNYREEYWIKIDKLQEYKKLYQTKLISKLDTVSILRAVDLCLDNNEILEGICCFYLRNKLIRGICSFIITYFLNEYKKFIPSLENKKNLFN